MKIEELRDELKIVSDREYELINELLADIEKKKSAPADPSGRKA